MSTQAVASGVVNRAYNNQRNFITPYVDRYGVVGKYAYELSHGKGIDGATVYGVTVVTLRGEKCRDLSTCLTSIADAEAYIKSLRSK